METRSRPSPKRILQTNEALPRFVIPIRRRTEGDLASGERLAPSGGPIALSDGKRTRAGVLPRTGDTRPRLTRVVANESDLQPLSSHTCVAYGEGR